MIFMFKKHHLGNSPWFLPFQPSFSRCGKATRRWTNRRGNLPIIMVQWKTTLNERKGTYVDYFHDYGRSGKKMAAFCLKDPDMS